MPRRICIAARSRCRPRWRSPTSATALMAASSSPRSRQATRLACASDSPRPASCSCAGTISRAPAGRSSPPRPPRTSWRSSPEAARHALGIAGSLGAGLMAAQEGAMSKRLHSGRAAQAGVVGAQLAARGFTGIPNVLEASYGGFLSTLSGEPEMSHLTRGLGTDWEIRKVGFKPYATAASVQSVLFAIDALMAENSLTADDIERVVIHCSTMAHRHCAWPYEPVGRHRGADEHVLRRRHDDRRSQRHARPVPRGPPDRSGGAGDDRAHRRSRPTRNTTPAATRRGITRASS